MDLNIELNTKPISPVRLFFPNHTLAIEYDIHIWQQPKCGDTVKYEFDFFNLAAFTSISPPTHTPSISLSHTNTPAPRRHNNRLLHIRSAKHRDVGY